MEHDNASTDDIEALFIMQAKEMHGVLSAEDNVRACGREWTVDPAFGTGSYWYLTLDATMAIAVFDLLFYTETSFGSRVPSFFCFGSYGRNMIPYFAPHAGLDEGWDGGTLLGYAWRDSMFKETVRANERLMVCSFSLLPRAITRLSREIGCKPLTLSSAIASLDGTHRILALLRLFDEVREARLSTSVAQAYYRCKIVEACALVVDWAGKRKDGDGPRIRPTDRTTFNLACSYAREHLERPITLDELCRATCVSASKLTSLFKAIEHTTPLGYVRNLRMEHAREMLANSDKPLSSIASCVGFSHQGSFSEAFKNCYGMTPSRYRSMSQRG